MRGLILHVSINPDVQPTIVGYYEDLQKAFFTDEEKSEVASASEPELKAAEIFDTKYKTISPNP